METKKHGEIGGMVNIAVLTKMSKPLTHGSGQAQYSFDCCSCLLRCVRWMAPYVELESGLVVNRDTCHASTPTRKLKIAIRCQFRIYRET